MRANIATNSLSEVPAKSLMIASASQPCTMSHDVKYPYHPCRLFWYMCQLESYPAVIVYENLHSRWQSHLFLPEKDSKRLLWEGDYLYSSNPAASNLADVIHDLATFDDWLKKQRYDHVFIDPDDSTLNKIAYPAHTTQHNLRKHLSHKRLIKQSDEIDAMREACQISASCHNKLMQVIQPGMNERELEGNFILAGYKMGVRQQAYPAIVAGSERACILHYQANDKPIKYGDLVLVDAGWTYRGQCADITRSFPANGRFSPAQRDIYTLVLQCQQETIDLIKPGCNWDMLRKKSYQILANGLVSLGIFQSMDESIDKTREFFPHGIGHWLGLDVHDPCPYQIENQPITFEPGMTLTIEPGLYFPNHDHVPNHYRGIGIRIEDNCLVTAKSCDVLTHKAVKQLDDIEDLMNAS